MSTGTSTCTLNYWEQEGVQGNTLLLLKKVMLMYICGAEGNVEITIHLQPTFSIANHSNGEILRQEIQTEQ